jgi:hypothetical protein
VIDTRAPALQQGKGGDWTVPLGFTNLTNKDITIQATPTHATDSGCQLSLDRAQLRSAEHTAVILNVPPGCNVRKDGFDFNVSVTGGTSSPITFPVTAAPKPDTSKPEWRALGAFPVIFGGLFIAACICLVVLAARRSASGWTYSTELKYLDSTWSFTDSWVSNVTVIGGLLAGIFGSSSVVKALLGNDADSSIALATVGAAVAAAIIAAGPIVLLATKSQPARKSKRAARRVNARGSATTRSGDCITLGGFVFAAVVTLTGAAGEIWVVYRSAQKLDLGGWQHKIVYLAVLGFALLALYAIRTIPATIIHGTTAPDAVRSDTLKAADLIVAALKAHGRVLKAHSSASNAELEEAMRSFPEEVPALEPIPGAARPRPKSALL